MEHEQRPFGDKPSLEEIVKVLEGKKEFNDKLNYLLEALKKYEGLGDKLRLIDGIPKAKERAEIRIKAAQEVLKEPLGNRKFSDLYGICHLESKEKNPDGYHLVYMGQREAPINLETIPVNLAADLLNHLLITCYYHYIGFITGAIARNKPHEVLPFNPSQELQQIVESATQEYKIVIRQNPARNYKIKPEEGIVAAVIFEDRGLYTDHSKREAVVNYLQEAEKAVHLYKEGQISKEELDAIIRIRLRLPKTQEEFTIEQLSQPLEGKPYRRDIYPLPIKLEDPEWVKEINPVAARYRQGYQVVVISAKEGLIGAAFDEEFTGEKLEKKLEETFEDVKWQIGRIKNLIQTGIVRGQIGEILNKDYERHQQQPEEEKVMQKGVYEIDYVPSSPGHIEDVNLMLSNLGHMLKTPFSFLYTEEGKRAKVSLGGNATQEYFNGIAPLAQRLEALLGIWRKDSTKGKETLDSIYQAFGVFGQQPQ